MGLCSLKKYAFSETLIDCFYGTYVTPLFFRDIPGVETSVDSGTLNDFLDLVEYSGRIFVGDILDGGVTMYLFRSYEDSRPSSR